MSDLISREALLEKLEEYIEYDTFDSYKEEPLISLGFEQLEDIICSQPTVEAKEAVHGEWIAQNEGLTRFMCSVCNGKNHGGHEKFCPNCGADMRKKV